MATDVRGRSCSITNQRFAVTAVSQRTANDQGSVDGYSSVIGGSVDYLNIFFFVIRTLKVEISVRSKVTFFHMAYGSCSLDVEEKR